jgi:hypothetical protein
MKRLWSGVLIATLSHAALAGNLDNVRKEVQASMLVTGTIDVAPDGNVAGYNIDHSDKLPKPVNELIAQGVPTWKFEPPTSDGKPVLAKANMSLRIVAKYLDKEHMALTIGGAQFGKKNVRPGEEVEYKDHSVKPHYPMEAARSRVSGTVYVLLRVRPDGQVQDAVAQQVNLKSIDTESGMEHWRKLFSDAALHAATRWTFTPPTIGTHVHDPYWVARVPVAFSVDRWDNGKNDYGKWNVYIPGPIQPVMWPDKDKMFTGAPDAMPGDGLYQVEQSLRLTTPLNGA